MGQADSRMRERDYNTLKQLVEISPFIIRELERQLREIREGLERTAKHDTIWYSDFDFPAS